MTPKSPYRGVFWNPASKSGPPWKVQIHAQGKQIYGGRYHTPEEAAGVYNELAELLHGERAQLNEVR